VKSIGARAILDFPDEINFQMTAVKSINKKTLLVRNIGNKDAKFSLTVEKYVKNLSENKNILFFFTVDHLWRLQTMEFCQ
jgi:hypothetical protein